MTGNTQRQRINMNIKVRELCRHFVPKLHCGIQVIRIGNLQPNIILKGAAETFLHIITDCIDHNGFALGYRSRLGKGVQLLALYLQYGFQSQNRTQCSGSRRNPAAFLQIIQCILHNIDTGIIFIRLQELFNPGSIHSLLCQLQCI